MQMHDEVQEPGMNWRSHRVLLFPLLLSAVLLWNHFQVVPLTMDGVTYLQIARNILNGFGLGWQALWVPPLHSVLIAAVARLGVGDLLVAATVLSVAEGFLLVGVVYALGCELLNRRAGLVAATLAALSPHLIKISYSPEAEISYALFLLLGLFFFIRALKSNSWGHRVGAGLAFALAYLSRSEGILILLMVLGAVVLLQVAHRLDGPPALRKCAVVLLVFLVACAPYLSFLKKHYGSLVVSPKSSYVMTWMKYATYHDNNLGEEENPELWGLSANGRLCWQEPQGVGDLVRYLGSHPGKSLSVYLHDLAGEIPGRIPNGSGMERFPQVFPVYLALLALFAFFGDWGSQGRGKKAVLAAPFGILLVLPVFTAGWWKYLVPYLPILIVAAGVGVARLGALLAPRLPAGVRSREWVGTLALLAGLCLVYGWALLPGRPAQPAPESRKTVERREAMKAGAYGRQLLGPGRNFMISWSPLVYYLDGYWTARPVTSYEGQLAYAWANKVEYIVYDVSRPDITLEQMMDAPGLQVVGAYQSQETPFKVVFFKLPPPPY